MTVVTDMNLCKEFKTWEGSAFCEHREITKKWNQNSPFCIHFFVQSSLFRWTLNMNTVLRDKSTKNYGSTQRDLQRKHQSVFQPSAVIVYV